MALEETVLDGEECDWCNLTEKKKEYLLFTTDFWSAYLADEQDYVGFKKTLWFSIRAYG